MFKDMFKDKFINKNICFVIKKILNFFNKVVLTKRAKYIFFVYSTKCTIYAYVHSHTKLNIYKPRLIERY